MSNVTARADRENIDGMTSLTDLLAQEGFEPTGDVEPEQAYADLKEQAKEDPDFALSIALPMLLAEEGMDPVRRRTLTRQWDRVQLRLKRRARHARQHAARLRASNIVVKKFVPRSRERSDRRTSRTRSRDPDDGDGPAPKRRRRGRGDERRRS